MTVLVGGGGGWGRRSGRRRQGRRRGRVRRGKDRRGRGGGGRGGGKGRRWRGERGRRRWRLGDRERGRGRKRWKGVGEGGGGGIGRGRGRGRGSRRGRGRIRGRGRERRRRRGWMHQVMVPKSWHPSWFWKISCSAQVLYGFTYHVRIMWRHINGLQPMVHFIFWFPSLPPTIHTHFIQGEILSHSPPQNASLSSEIKIRFIKYVF